MWLVYAFNKTVFLNLQPNKHGTLIQNLFNFEPLPQDMAHQFMSTLDKSRA